MTRFALVFGVLSLMMGCRTSEVRLSRTECLRERIQKTCQIKAEDQWHGYDRIVFEFRGREAWVVRPKVAPLPGNPWTWTMQWADAFVPETGVPDLLAKGFHHVTLAAFDERATDDFLPMFAAFQAFLVKELGFAPRVNLVGLSWGGFFSTRYAAAYPQNVARIYLDAPLMNFDSFVHGSGLGPWENAKPSDGNWSNDPRMPVNLAEKLAAAKLPILLFYGVSDTVVDPKLNCEAFIGRFKKAGGDIFVVKRPHGHHPHGGGNIDERRPIIDFFMKSSTTDKGEA